MTSPVLDTLLTAKLQTLAQENGLRRLRGFRRNGLRLTDQSGRELIDFSSNDYLGLVQHPRLIAAAIDWTQRLGTGAAASRLVTGTYEKYREVEQRLAAFKGSEAALVLGSGFQANATVLPAVIELLQVQGPVRVFADRLNHASLHHGLAAAGLRQIRFRHNDLNHLESLLRKEATESGPRLIVTESVFSMDGDRCDLAALADLAERYGAITYVDEAHATGVLGPQGRGLTATIPGRIDIVMGTLGKALGGYGAYIAGSQTLIDYLVTRCSGFIYSTALPPAVFGALDAALDLVPQMEAERAHLHRQADRLRSALCAAGLATGRSDTQIVPVILGEAADTLAAQRQLEEAGFLGIAIRPPTVPAGQSRLRLSLSAAHREEDLDRLIAAITKLGRSS
ncbi:aminotransferase class I/II-fold pyridoxal phosphate-dependent enzyme [Dongia soli]|uniref:8-amino-7-oxononanoate synthase n=1 Tax=Dongia soli TaxID=600628 RepID=A0ABU5ECS4_9PROT|nr:8-amino-7-oxononanoate synthase [Dongia soli]MDY0883702.1 8-amino-7-oxononanoate synthase [Dongia soli]